MGMREGDSSKKGVDDDGDEFVDVDMEMRLGDADGSVEMRRDGEARVGEAPLEVEAVAVATHGNIGGVRAADEVWVAWYQKADGSRPDGRRCRDEELFDVIEVVSCEARYVEATTGVPCSF